MTSWCPKEQLWSFNFCNIRQTLQVTDLRGKKRVEWVCFCHHKTPSSATGAGDSGYFWEGWCSAACRHTLWLGGGELRLSASAFRRRNEPLLPWSCNNTQTWWRVCFDLRTHRCLVSLIVSLHSLLCFFNPFIMASHQPLPLLSTPPLSAFFCLFRKRCYHFASNPDDCLKPFTLSIHPNAILHAPVFHPNPPIPAPAQSL